MMIDMECCFPTYPNRFADDPLLAATFQARQRVEDSD